MESSNSEGLRLSVLVYMAAMIGALAVFVLPVYWATRPTVFDNPPLVRSDFRLNGPAIGYRGPATVPLAMLKQQDILDPAIVAALNAKANGAKSARVKRASRPAAQRSQATSMAELQPERSRRTFFPFSLF